MRKLGAWGLEVALVVGLSAAAAWAGEEGEESLPPPKPSYGRRGVFDILFAPKPKPPAKKANAKTESKPAPKADTPSEPAPVVDEAVAERRREEAAFLRRDAVCDRLMEIALQTGDQELLERVEQLRERAWTAYAQRTAHLPGGKAVFESDEQILKKHLGTGSSAEARPGDAPAHTVTSTDRRSHAAVKEETP